MWNRLYVLGLVLLLVFVLFSPGFAQDEQLTVTTYYPSPFGSYRDLGVSNILAVGPVTPAGWGLGANPVAPGTILLSGTSAGIDMLDRTITAPAGPGSVFSWYNSTGALRLATLAPGGGKTEILGITRAGRVRENVSPTKPNGCFRMSYGSRSGLTRCPEGNVDLLLSLPNPANENGGYFYCCG